MITKYFIYLVDYETHFTGERKLILISNQTQETYNGFDNITEAENWILHNGIKGVSYTILPIYKHL